MTRRAAILALALLTVPVRADLVLFNGVTPAGGGCTNTSIMTWWRAEGTTHSTGDYPASTTAWTANGTVSLSATAAKNGSTGVYSVAAADYYSTPISSQDRAHGTAGRVGFWYRWETGSSWPSGYNIISVRKDANYKMRVMHSATSGKLDVRWTFNGSTQQTVTMATTLSINTWYWIEAAYDAGQAGGSDVLKIYLNGVEDAGAATYTLTPFDAGNVPTTLYVGDVDDGAFGRKVHIDHIIVASDSTKDLSACKDTVSYP